MANGIETDFQAAAAYVALFLEAATLAIVLIGAVEALVHSLSHVLRDRAAMWTRRMIWRRFALWILLALEFALGADIIRTAVAPSWDDVGKLAAIAAIRTGLSYFLTRDIEEVRAPDKG